MENKNRGFTHILIFLAVAAILAAVVVIFFFSNKSGNSLFKTNTSDSMMMSEDQSTPIPSASPVSDSKNLDTIEKEIDSTNITSPDTDLKTMESEAASL